MGNWFDAEAQSHRDLQQEFGEYFTIRPMMQSPNFAPTFDPARAVYSIVVMFEWEAKEIGLGLDDTKVSSRSPKFTYMRCDLPYEIRRGDYVQRCQDKSTFEVTDVERDGVSGACVELVQMGRQS